MLPICKRNECRPTYVVKDGYFYRKSDRQKIQRWKCNQCQGKFSAATGKPPFGQNKRNLNNQILKLLCSGVSMRRVAMLLNIHRITVARKLKYLAGIANQVHDNSPILLSSIRHVQFDDLITIEHTKCKPLSVSIAVNEVTGQIIDLEVSVIPAFGHLAKIARQKYGPRPNLRKGGIQTLFKRMSPFIHPQAIFKTDKDTLYPSLIKKYYPKVEHVQYKGAKGCVAGQGELKRLGFDPLFCINHTFALLRANINRLFRRTWCTTKKKERLYYHLSLYRHFHNTILLG